MSKEGQLEHDTNMRHEHRECDDRDARVQATRRVSDEPLSITTATPRVVSLLWALAGVAAGWVCMVAGSSWMDRQKALTRDITRLCEWLSRLRHGSDRWPSTALAGEGRFVARRH